MKYDYDIVIIGGGSGGLVVASGAASLGAKVLLIENEKMGGDCLNYGCVPSKSFLKGAHLAKEINNSSIFGIEAQINNVDIGRLMERVSNVVAAIAPHDSIERFEGMGVKVVIGNGQILDNHHVKVGNETFFTKNIVISTGSKAFIPQIKGLDTVPYLTNKNIFDIKKMPKHLIVLGGGPIGLELGQGFKHLGAEVTIIDRNQHLFGKDEVEVGILMEEVFVKDGMNLRLSTKIIEIQYKDNEVIVVIEKDGVIEKIVGDNLLVSLGRAPATEGLGLEKAGIKISDRGYIITNSKLQTNYKNIYACGDITGPYQFTHMAGYQAGIIIKNCIFHLGSKVNYSAVPWTTYTKPEVAHVGHTEGSAKKTGVFKKAINIPLEKNDRAKAENDEVGFLKIIINNKNIVVGATLVSDKAGEMIPIANLAVSQKLKLSVFLDVIFSYPTESEIFKSAASQSLKDSLTPWKANLVKKLFIRR